jgi:hypothetical protein
MDFINFFLNKKKEKIDKRKTTFKILLVKKKK